MTGAADSATGDDDRETLPSPVTGASKPEEVATRSVAEGQCRGQRRGAFGPERADERTRTSTPEGTGT